MQNDQVSVHPGMFELADHQVITAGKLRRDSFGSPT
jgi:hypothetical protein